MAIDPSIIGRLDTRLPLTAQVADTTGAIQKGLLTRSQYDKAKEARETKGIRQKLLEQAGQKGEQDITKGEQDIAKGERDAAVAERIRELQSMYQGVTTSEKFVGAGDYQGLRQFLGGREQELIENNRNPENTQMFKSQIEQEMSYGAVDPRRSEEIMGELAQDKQKILEEIDLLSGKLSTQTGKEGLASATTTTWKNGTTLFNLPNGTQRLVFQGREITDPVEIKKVIEDANQSGLALAGEKSRITAKSAEEGKAEGAAETLDTRMDTAEVEAEQTRKESEQKIKSDRVAQDYAETEVQLREAETGMPALKQTISQLGQNEEATYTIAGRAYNEAKKQLGGEPPEAAIQRTKMLSTIKNNVLPMLRRMLGSAFTAKEAEMVITLYGDPNSHPAERKAALDSLYEAAETELGRLQTKMQSFDPKAKDAAMQKKQERLQQLRQQQAN